MWDSLGLFIFYGSPSLTFEAPEPPAMATPTSVELENRDGEGKTSENEGESPEQKEDAIASRLGGAHVVERLAMLMAKMTPVGSEIIRAAPAYASLSSRARPLRGFKRDNFIHLSSETDHIDQFWSQSWHSHRLSLVMTVMFFNNSKGAAIISLVVASLLGVLYSFEIIPELFENDYDVQELHRSGWSACGAVIAYFVTLALWRNRSRIFLDVLCIDQEDGKKKLQALFSMGAILKSSKSFMLFWDPTYTTRLWCLFELAAFLKSRREGEKPEIIIRPTIAGPCFLLVTFSLTCILLVLMFLQDRNVVILFGSVAALFCLGTFFAISRARAYFRSMNDLMNALTMFQLSDARSFCCDNNHPQRGRGPMLCDRDVIVRCITEWFGSVQNFEENVRTIVQESLKEQLRKQTLSYQQCVLILIPFIYATIDMVSAQIRVESYGQALNEGVRGCSLWLGVGPILFFQSFKMSQFLCRRCKYCLLDFLLNLSIVVTSAATLMAAMILEQVFYHTIVDIRILGNHMVVGSCIHACIFIGIALLSFRCFT